MDNSSEHNKYFFEEEFFKIDESYLLSLLEDYAKRKKSSICSRIRDFLPVIAGGEEVLILANRGQAIPSPVFIESGVKSFDDVSLLGLNGYMFVWGGNNSLAHQYGASVDDPHVVALKDDWISLIAKRAGAMSNKGIRFLQIIVPEKQSLLPQHVPVSFSVPTPLFTAIDTEIKNNQFLTQIYGPSFLDFQQLNSRRNIFQRTDSHLTPSGAFDVFNRILLFLGYTPIPSLPFDDICTRRGDLACHFFGLPFCENIYFPSSDWMSDATQSIKIINMEHPSDGGHVDFVGHWKNDKSFSPLRVLVFGNSFFERGGDCIGLSWWGKYYFREFKFIWQSNVNYDEVDNFKPDLLICQTIERFLPGLPAS